MVRKNRKIRKRRDTDPTTVSSSSCESPSSARPELPALMDTKEGSEPDPLENGSLPPSPQPSREPPHVEVERKAAVKFKDEPPVVVQLQVELSSSTSTSEEDDYIPGLLVRTYRKVQAVFKCSNLGCEKTWKSSHAWRRQEEVNCWACGAVAKERGIRYEYCELGNYDCSTCGRFWQSIYFGQAEKCENCGKLVQSEGSQVRFGGHFWFECSNRKCGKEFQDFFDYQRRTQRCGRCLSRGEILRYEKPTRILSRGRGSSQLHTEHTNMHNWRNCDMCCDLKGQGKAESCLELDKVRCQVIKLTTGVYVERIVGLGVAESGPAA